MLNPERTSNKIFLVPLFAGLLPALAVCAAYLININQLEISACMPLWSGCTSISRAVRSGAGLILFKSLALPAAALAAMSWFYLSAWVRKCELGSAGMIRAFSWLGVIAAAFMAMYVINLGLDGSVYRFMRRFGITVFFGFTAISQLLLVRLLWPQRNRLPPAIRMPVRWLTLIVSLEWFVGVGGTAKRLVIRDPVIMTRVENVIEWWFALLLAASFLLLAWLLAGSDAAGEGTPAES
jgi:hypothetical protein